MKSVFQNSLRAQRSGAGRATPVSDINERSIDHERDSAKHALPAYTRELCGARSSYLRVEVPVYPDNLPRTNGRGRPRLTHENCRCPSITWNPFVSSAKHGKPWALDLCWGNGVAVNFLSEHGHFQARMTGVADTSVTLRRTQFRAADDPVRCAAIARQIIAGKIQNARNSLLRASRESDDAGELRQLQTVTDALANQIHLLAELTPASADLDALRGAEGLPRNNIFRFSPLRSNSSARLSVHQAQSPSTP